LEREGIIIIRLDNKEEAKEYGLDHLPGELGTYLGFYLTWDKFNIYS
jgi:hypothetical protein